MRSLITSKPGSIRSTTSTFGDVLNGFFEAVEFDLISNTKRFRPEQQMASEKILQDILKCKPDRNTAILCDLNTEAIPVARR